ncbi:MAG: glycosyltransferase [Planctomycetes bacterium]|nr:glycosyltransferase [Planctomycetota bacterium]
MPPRHLLTIAVEEFCDDPALRAIVSPTHRQRFEPRVEADVEALLDLLAQQRATATFCVSAAVASRHPALLERIAAAGHELGARSGVVPVTVERRFWWVRPLATGEALRRRPWSDLQRRLRARAAREPLVLAIASWEIDPAHPVVRGAGGRVIGSHYDGLARFRERLTWCLREFPFVAAAAEVGMALAPLPRAPTPACAVEAAPPAVSPEAAAAARTRVSLVVPLLDEAEGLPYLLRTLRLLQERLADRWQFEFVLVDDGSTDATWPLLQQAAAGRTDIVLARHEKNRGVAAAIQTGMRTATADIVASIDGDCSYDPAELAHMLPLLADADLVTASPYHPRGAVANVPAWRLWLSRGLSRIYRLLLRRDIHTWTSCFRVYRKDLALSLALDNERFLGIAELLIRLVRRGARIVEHPAVLESRLLGFSKMKTLRTIRDHLRLCWRVLRGQVR